MHSGGSPPGCLHTITQHRSTRRRAHIPVRAPGPRRQGRLGGAPARLARHVVPGLLPYTKAFYSEVSHYSWWDELPRGKAWNKATALPQLSSLAQHRALVGANAALPPNATLAAYLDDLYVVTTVPHARAAYDVLTRAVAAHKPTKERPASSPEQEAKHPLTSKP